MRHIELNNAFQNIVTTYSLKSIRSLFLGEKPNYKPAYQREYVWPAFKATYFIETILLHAEFSPIVAFELRDTKEVIDGRQRCETIDLFLSDQLILKASGLEKLWYLANKKFSQLSPALQERILSAKIRVITIQFRNESNISQATEELVKREFFRRYNLGLTPLKKEEVYKAQYLQDDINIYFKRKFQQDNSIRDQVSNIFDHRSKNIEIQMQHIRQMLVLQNIPINRYLSEKDDIINKYYDYLSYDNTGHEKARLIYIAFKDKISFLFEFKRMINKETGRSNGLLYECLYWALSIADAEKVKFDKIDNPVFKDRLIKCISKHLKLFALGQGNQSQQIKARYEKIAEFFSSQLHVSFLKYLKNDQFIVDHKDRMEKYMKERFMPGLEQDYFSKTTPTSSTIMDILDQIKKQKFNIRPPYQREEVKDKTKASSLIESILKGIKLHPIYVYVRRDGVYEVIDGQQRLLTIIGFIGETYRNEEGNLEVSKKHNFSLVIKSGLMQELHGKKFGQLPEELQKCILNFEIYIIEIREENNLHFKPEELFKRLNYKPFPIKEHSFEFWNAYADTEIIATVKEIYQKHNWLYLRKANKRMLNEELLMYLIYFNLVSNGPTIEFSRIKEAITILLWNGKVSLKIKNKAYITKLFEIEKRRKDFLEACQKFEHDFVAKLKVLTYHPDSQNSDQSRSRQLDSLLHGRGTRTFMNFCLLWIILRGIPVEIIYHFRPAVKNKINKIFALLGDVDTVEEMEKSIVDAWQSLNKNKVLPASPII